MYARGPCGNGDDLAGLGSEHVAGGGDELGEHERRCRGRRGLEVVPGGRERPPERGGHGQGAEARLERLQSTQVILDRDRVRWEQPFGGADHEPEGEQSVPLGPAGRSGEEPDEALFRRCRRPGHATRRCAAAATSAGVMSPRQR